MRDYQPRRNNKYILPTPVYHQTVWLIRDYDRICGELEDIMVSSPDPSDGLPRAANQTDEVFTKAARRETLLARKEAIDTALGKVPVEYRTGIWDSVQLRRSFPNDAARATYGKWKSRFIYEVAITMGLVDKK